MRITGRILRNSSIVVTVVALAAAGTTGLARAAGPVTSAALHPAYAPGGVNAASATVQSPLVSHGGPVQTAPRIYIDFWGWPTTLTAAQSNFQTTLTNFYKAYGGSDEGGINTQYGAGNPASQVLGTWHDNTNAIPSNPDNNAVANEAARLGAHFNNYNQNIAYVVVRAPGHGSYVYNKGWCAYHATATGGSLPFDIPFVDLPYLAEANTCGAQYSAAAAATIVPGHELVETQTDPFGNAWKDSNGQEIADKCNFGTGGLSPRQRIITSTSFWVQPMFNNHTDTCTFYDTVSATSISSSASGGSLVTHSASVSCSVSNADGVSQAFYSATSGAGDSTAVSGDVICYMSNTDPNTSGSFSMEGTSTGSGSASVSGTRSTGARGTNTLCVSGTVGFADGTNLSIAKKCKTV